MALTLQLVFKKSDGKDFVLTVDEPRPGITPTEVQTANGANYCFRCL